MTKYCKNYQQVPSHPMAEMTIVGPRSRTNRQKHSCQTALATTMVDRLVGLGWISVKSPTPDQMVESKLNAKELVTKPGPAQQDTIVECAYSCVIVYSTNFYFYSLHPQRWGERVRGQGVTNQLQTVWQQGILDFL